MTRELKSNPRVALGSKNRANGVGTYCKSCWRQYRLTYVEPPKGSCLVKGCSVPARCRGCCLKHYQQWRRGQLVVEGLPARAPTVCAVDGCNSPVFGRGWCSKHDGRWKKHGDPVKETKSVTFAIVRPASGRGCPVGALPGPGTRAAASRYRATGITPARARSSPCVDLWPSFHNPSGSKTALRSDDGQSGNPRSQ
jgi:hypothetical protein